MLLIGDIGLKLTGASKLKVVWGAISAAEHGSKKPTKTFRYGQYCKLRGKRSSNRFRPRLYELKTSGSLKTRGRGGAFKP